MAVTVEEVLRSWRRSIQFADPVRTSLGALGNVVGREPDDRLTVVLEDRNASPRKLLLLREDLFPAWWPEAQFKP